MAESLVRPVVQVHVCYFERFTIECRWIDRKAVILRRDFDLLGEKILDGVIASPVTEFQLEGFRLKRERQQLMTETDAEDGRFADKALEIFDGLPDSRRVARTVGDKDAVRSKSKNFLGGI